MSRRSKPGRGQLSLDRDQRLAEIRELREKLAAIETPDISWEGRSKMKTRPCPCECNSGGFCGGCGHAGCGGRR